MRPLAHIDAELAAVRDEAARLARIHDALIEERNQVLPLRNRAIVSAFDAGHTVKRIAFDLDETVNAVWQVLRRAGRSARSRRLPVSHLPAEQQRLYHKARAIGHGPGVARQMATLHERSERR